MKHGLTSPTTDFMAAVTPAKTARPGQSARQSRPSTETFTLADKPGRAPDRTPLVRTQGSSDRTSAEVSRTSARANDRPSTQEAGSRVRENSRRNDQPRSTERTDRDERARDVGESDESRQPDKAEASEKDEATQAAEGDPSAEKAEAGQDEGKGEKKDEASAEAVPVEAEAAPAAAQTGLITAIPDAIAAPLQPQVAADGAAPDAATPPKEGVAALDAHATPSSAGKGQPVATTPAKAEATVIAEAGPGPAEAAGGGGATPSGNALPAGLTPGTAAPGSHGVATASAATQANGHGGAPHPVIDQVPLGAVPIEIGLKSLSGVNRFEIRLDPAELGRVDVRLEIDDSGGIKAHLTVDRVETLALLQRDARTLERAFEQAGLKPSDSGIDLSLRDGSGQGTPREGRDQDTGGRSGPRGGLAEAGVTHPIEAQTRTIWRGRAGIDLRI